MSSLILATRNTNKTREIAQMLGRTWEVSDLTALKDTPKIEETGTTFEANAALKALGISRCFRGLVLADDSGLEVDGLNGEPGVFSARYAGPEATDASNRQLVIANLKKKNMASGSPGRFRCAMVLAAGGEMVGSFADVVEGTVLTIERGTGGFGYDPIFVPRGYDETFGELSSLIKNSLSHRSRALAAVIASLEDFTS